MKDALDGWAGAAAMRLVSWLDGRVDASRRGWIAALAAETEDIDGGWSKLRWAINGLPLAWSFRRPPAPRVAGAWNTAVNPRLLIAALNRNKTDLGSYTMTACLAGIVVVLAMFIMPFVQAVMAGGGLSLPLATRVVMAILSSPYFIYGLLLTPLLLHWYTLRTRKPAIPARRALPVLNVICVIALIGLTSGLLEFFSNIRPVLRASFINSGWSPPAPTTAPLLRSQQIIHAAERRGLPR